MGVKIATVLKESIIFGIFKALQFLDAGWGIVWGGLKNVVIWAWNGIITAAEIGAQGVIDVINDFIDKYNKAADLLGLDTLAPIPDADFSAFKGEVKTWEQVVDDANASAQQRFDDSMTVMGNFIDMIEGFKLDSTHFTALLDDVADAVGKVSEEWLQVIGPWEDSNETLKNSTRELTFETEKLALYDVHIYFEIRDEILYHIFPIFSELVRPCKNTERTRD